MFHIILKEKKGQLITRRIRQPFAPGSKHLHYWLCERQKVRVYHHKSNDLPGLQLSVIYLVTISTKENPTENINQYRK